MQRVRCTLECFTWKKCGMKLTTKECLHHYRAAVVADCNPWKCHSNQVGREEGATISPHFHSCLNGWRSLVFTNSSSLLLLCDTSSWFEDNIIGPDYKCTGHSPSLSRNQLMAVCGEIVSPQNASTTSESNLRLIVNGQESLFKSSCGSIHVLFSHFNKVQGNEGWNINFKPRCRTL